MKRLSKNHDRLRDASDEEVIRAIRTCPVHYGFTGTTTETFDSCCCGITCPLCNGTWLSTYYFSYTTFAMDGAGTVSPAMPNPVPLNYFGISPPAGIEGHLGSKATWISDCFTGQTDSGVYFAARIVLQCWVVDDDPSTASMTLFSSGSFHGGGGGGFSCSVADTFGWTLPLSAPNGCDPLYLESGAMDPLTFTGHKADLSVPFAGCGYDAATCGGTPPCCVQAGVFDGPLIVTD